MEGRAPRVTSEGPWGCRVEDDPSGQWWQLGGTIRHPRERWLCLGRGGRQAAHEKWLDLERFEGRARRPTCASGSEECGW